MIDYYHYNYHTDNFHETTGNEFTQLQKFIGSFWQYSSTCDWNYIYIFFKQWSPFSIYLYFSSWTHKLLLVSSSAVTIEIHNRRCVLGEQLSYLIGNQIQAAPTSQQSQRRAGGEFRGGKKATTNFGNFSALPETPSIALLRFLCCNVCF